LVKIYQDFFFEVPKENPLKLIEVLFNL